MIAATGPTLDHVPRGRSRRRAASPLRPFSPAAGLLPRQDIRKLVHRHVLRATEELDESQFQPASLDLRLGSQGLPGARELPARAASKTVEEQLAELRYDEIDLDDGAVLETRLRLCRRAHRAPAPAGQHLRDRQPEELDRPARRLHAPDRRPQRESSTACPAATRAGSTPRSRRAASASRCARGSRLNQIRFRRRNSQQDEHADFRLTDRELQRAARARRRSSTATSRSATASSLRVELGGIGAERLVGYRAQRHTDVIDVDRVGAYAVEDFWEPIRARADGRLILDPNEFYILASKERLHIPPDLRGRDGADRPDDGRVPGPLRRLLRSRLRLHARTGRPGQPRRARGAQPRGAVRPRGRPDGRPARLRAHGRATRTASTAQIGTSNYQGQELKLSKHFA